MNRFNFEKERASFLNLNVGRLPSRWRQNAIEKFCDIEKKQGTAAACEWLRVLVEPLENLLNIALDDDDLKKLALDMARHCKQAVAKYDKQFLKITGGANMYLPVINYWREACISYGVRYPEEHDIKGVQARLICDLWWLRNLRASHARAREIAAINAGIVHKRGDLYVSDDTLERREQQNKRNAAILSGVKMRNESGQIMALDAIAAAGVSNPVNRHNELITRLKGFEKLSIKYGHKAEFITITCPSRMHAVKSDGVINPKYDGTTPADAQKYLVKQWALVRSRLHRDGFKFYGLRVAEPHHDGTPHWHVILFYKDEKITFASKEDCFSGVTYKAVDYLRGVIFKYFAAGSYELGSIKNRVKFVAINPLKGSAVGYVVKYVSKNIGGIEGEKSDEAQKVSSESAAARVEAWASTWRIRQFQQVGGHSVSVWRELRRVDGDKIPSDFNEIMRAWRAAQKLADKKNADYAAFIEAMGGLQKKPRESVLSIDDDYIVRRGRYGETVARILKGVRLRFGLDAVANNRESWVRV